MLGLASARTSIAARSYARIVNLLLRNEDAFPGFDDVLPACEALNALLFHRCICHREDFCVSLTLARRLCFAEPLTAPHSGRPVAGIGELASLFKRAVDEFSSAQAVSTARSARGEQLTIQITELAGLLLRDVATEAELAS